MLAHDPDADVVTRFQAGDITAFDTLWRKYRRIVLRRQRSLLRNSSDAKDASQNTWLNVFKHLEHFRGTSKFSSWLYRIAVNDALMVMRNRKLHRVRSVPIEKFIEALATDQIPVDDLIYYRQIEEAMRALFDRLPDNYKHIASMFYEGSSISELSSHTRLNVGATKSRLHRSRNLIRKRMENERSLFDLVQKTVNA